MLEILSKWWERNGFSLLVIGSIVFFLVCWIMGWKPKKGRAGKLQDYISDIFAPDKISKKRNPKKSEERCREIVEDIFQRPFPSMRPDFLRNPETGRNLECDLMNPELKLCIERNGEQHYRQVDHFHTKEQYHKQLQRDKIKETLLGKNGYTFITIPYTIHYDILDQYIPYKLGKNPLYKPYVDDYYRRNGIIPTSR